MVGGYLEKKVDWNQKNYLEGLYLILFTPAWNFAPLSHTRNLSGVWMFYDQFELIGSKLKLS